MTVSCKRSPPPPAPSEPAATDAALPAALGAALSSALRAAAGDFDGDGRSELILVDAQTVRVVNTAGKELARAEAPSGIQHLAVADVDGDGRAEILAGWGATAQRRDGRARVSVLSLSGGALSEQVVLEPRTSRQEVAALAWGDGGLFVGWFESKYMVRIDRALGTLDGWRIQPIDRIRMATSLAVGDVDGDGVEDLVVGRVYGDQMEADGDAFVRRSDGQRVPIPIQGGVRALTIADVDGDGTPEIYIADGWNRDYGSRARGLLTRAHWTGTRFESKAIDDGGGQYALSQILPRQGSGRTELVTRGNAHIRLVARDGATWHARTIASGCRELVALNLDRRHGDELLALCDTGALRLEP